MFLFSKYPNLFRFFCKKCVIPFFWSKSSSSSKSARNTTGTPFSFSCCFDGAQLKRIISAYPNTGSCNVAIHFLHLGSLGYPCRKNHQAHRFIIGNQCWWWMGALVSGDVAIGVAVVLHLPLPKSREMSGDSEYFQFSSILSRMTFATASTQHLCVCVCQGRGWVRGWKRECLWARIERLRSQTNTPGAVSFALFWAKQILVLPNTVGCPQTTRPTGCRTYGCRRTRRIVCVRFAFYHKLDVREFSFQLAPIALWIAHRVNVRLPHLDVSLIDDVSNQCNGRIVAHLVQVVNLGGFSKHVAGYFRRQNGTQGVPNLGMVFGWWTRSFVRFPATKIPFFIKTIATKHETFQSLNRTKKLQLPS